MIREAQGKGFHIITFGCQMNVHDAEWLKRALVSRGFRAVPEEEAQIFVVLTCSVREKPEFKVYSLLGRLKGYAEKTPGVFAAVGGCVAQTVGQPLWGRFDFVRLLFGTDGTYAVPQALERLADEPGLRLSYLDFTEEYPERPLYALPDEKGCLQVKAYVNIMQGCDNYCAYCIVPFARGAQKSRKSAAIIEECRALADSGVREITLLGQNVNSYGLDSRGDGTGFASLLYRVSEIPGIERIRFTTSHPKDLALEVIEAFGRLPNLCPQLHLPLQSGSDRVLRAMGRKYTMRDYLEKVERLRRVCPDVTLSTDLIVGFPGETDEDFEMTLKAVSDAGFSGGFSFKYSDRPGTAAARMQPKVAPEISASRLERLQTLLDAQAYDSLHSCVGKALSVLVEGPDKRAGERSRTFQGREQGGRIVNFACSGDVSPVGKIIRVNIIEAKKHSLWGEAEEIND